MELILLWNNSSKRKKGISHNANTESSSVAFKCDVELGIFLVFPVNSMLEVLCYQEKMTIVQPGRPQQC